MPDHQPQAGQESSRSEAGSIDDLFEELSRELRGLAQVVFAEQDASHTLQPTALINEAWLKLSSRTDILNDKQHFLALAAKAMRHILTDHARSKATEKRGGRRARLTLMEHSVTAQESHVDALAFHDALERLSSLNQRHADVVEFRVLGTLRIPEIADLLGVSENTVSRDWQAARLWLRRELAEQ
ncbi:MAG: ECF-type sigma factor [Planctomycetota bacterium]